VPPRTVIAAQTGGLAGARQQEADGIDISASYRYSGRVINQQHHMPAFAGKGLHMIHRSPPTSATFGLLAAAVLLPFAGGCAQEAWTSWPSPCRFVTSMCASGDNLWIATEDQGLWRVALAAGSDRREAWWPVEVGFDPLPANVYGVAVDARGRVWFGTAGQGVAVFNGQAWKTYGVLDGCGGDRVFAIAADPTAAANVWIGTDHGLTRYVPCQGAAGTWHTYTRLHGLPSDQVTAVHVTPSRRVWIGTEADGLAWSDPPYDKWITLLSHTSLPDPGDVKLAGATPGLVSDMINAITVLPDGTVAAGTPAGLLLGMDGGKKWVSWHGLSPEPNLNYIRSLAADAAGGLWIATRQNGLVCLDVATGKIRTYTHPGTPPITGPSPLPPPSIPDNFASAVAVAADGSVWCGTYGAGVARLVAAAPPARAPRAAPGAPSTTAKQPDVPGERSKAPPTFPAPVQPADAKPKALAVPPLPAPAAVPTAADLVAFADQVRHVPAAKPDPMPTVLRLDDDWLTRGDWIGRHGRYWACICGICAPKNYIWGGGPEPVGYSARIGPAYADKDSLRYWVHWLNTDNPNSLEMPPTYLHSRVLKGYQPWDLPRRQAEWCDPGYSYPMAAEGPDLYCSLKIPDGLFYLSLYFNNKDGHQGLNRFRDFGLSIRRPPAGTSLWDVSGFDNWPELARGRVVDFWSGVYKRFLVSGPGEIVIRVSRNHSFCTILEGVMLDLVDELPVPYYFDRVSWENLAGERETMLTRPASAMSATDHPADSLQPPVSDTAAAAALFEELHRIQFVNPSWWATSARPAYAALARWYLKQSTEQVAVTAEDKALYAHLATCLYNLGLYSRWEAALTRAGITPARQIEKALRWDGKTYSFQGKGYAVIRAYLENRPLTAEESASGSNE